ncbi:MAG TPA: metalloregulator ArsR/SmtB family transcription factor [Phycisphaerae bacterium]|nr:winged helix-turn-helix transcriptional regulator [Phycisphaerae bacterium]HPU31836.1 metalloregulator ArsR/SmtB family transcription factor [Phycisphaerae bacterium]HQA43604.1 metalloregulator ArsR/SmtB family transcription factor [Phycisphaerae bacterium]
MTATRHKLIPMEQLEKAVEVLRVLAHPHRLRICDLLLGERMAVGELAEHLKIPPNAVSQHLNLMKAHGILDREREGKTVYYKVVDKRPCWLLDCIRGHQPAEE